MSRFWTKVRRCKHDPSDYYEAVYGCTCGDASEHRCKKCSVFYTEDPCGEWVGMSGWSHKRRLRFDRSKRSESA